MRDVRDPGDPEDVSVAHWLTVGFASLVVRGSDVRDVVLVGCDLSDPATRALTFVPLATLDTRTGEVCSTLTGLILSA